MGWLIHSSFTHNTGAQAGHTFHSVCLIFRSRGALQNPETDPHRATLDEEPWTGPDSCGV